MSQKGGTHHKSIALRQKISTLRERGWTWTKIAAATGKSESCVREHYLRGIATSTRDKVRCILLENGRLTEQEIANRLGITQSAVHYHVRILRETDEAVCDLFEE